MPSEISFDKGNTGFQAGIIHGPVNNTFYPQADSALNRLPYAKDAPFNTFTKQDDPTCLPDTRVDLLKEIYTWADGQEERCIFWLNGLAGTGKSTISRTIARRYSDEKRLGASFFFSRGGGDVGNASMFVTTIAFQLASSVPSFDEHLCNALAKGRDIVGQSLSNQWQQLILDPLSELSGNSCQSTYMLVVDALDECDNDSHIQTIIHLLGKTRLSKRVRLRVFLTSRREVPIRYEFYQVPDAEYKDFILHTISSETIDHDLSVFFKHNIELIRKKYFLDVSWPGEEMMKRLIQLASGLFIWAATTCRFIYEGKSFAPKRLGMILQGSSSAPTAPEKHLDSIYTTVLRQSIDPNFMEEEKEEAYHLLRNTLGTIVILYLQLSKLSLSRLLNTEVNTIDQALNDLHSVLDISDDQSKLLRLHHPSFRDYLLNKDRCKDADLWVDEKQAHQELARNCIRLMSSSLKQDVCGVDTPGTGTADIESERLEQCLPPEVRYACLYWIQHVQNAGGGLRDNDQVHCFLEEHVLHWVEALAWMRKVPEGVHALISLESFAAEGDCPSLLALLHDAKRYILYTRQGVEQAPLQTYLGLAFAPTRSILRSKFSNCIRRWIGKLPNVQDEWNALQQTLEGHSQPATSITFSPDGKLMVSVSEDDTAKIWDARSGSLQHTLKCSNIIKEIAFSPDGSILALRYFRTVELWDTGSGTLRQILKHSSTINEIAFSPDGDILASRCFRTVELWDTRSGTLRQTLESSLSFARAIAFSPDGRLLALGMNDCTIQLWDLGRGAALQQTLEGHLDWVSAIAFSPDGKLLASVSDQTVKLWNTKSGSLRKTLKGHLNLTSVANTVVFSPDSKLLALAVIVDDRTDKLASTSRSCTVNLWDTRSGGLQQTFHSPLGMVDITFSSDSKLIMLAWVSEKNGHSAVKIWDTGSGVLRRTLENHSDWVGAVTFSPDGKILASAARMYGRTIKLWDIGSQTVQQTLEDRLDRINTMAFSPDGKLLVSVSGNVLVSGNQTVQLWDTRLVAIRHTLEDHSNYIESVAFSSDGKLLASESSKGTVKLWDTESGGLAQMLESDSGSNGYLRWWVSIAFSPDGRLLASVSDRTVKLWDIESGSLRETVERNSRKVSVMAFSPDGMLLVWRSEITGTVKMWDTGSGALQQTLRDDWPSVNPAAFSLDGKLLALRSVIPTVEICDTGPGALRQTLEEGHSKWFNNMAISPDGKILALAPTNGVKLWDTGSGMLLQTLWVGTFVKDLAFSNDGRYLVTNRGSISILSGSDETTQPSLSSKIFVQDQWVVTPSLKRILWLPLDYRSDYVVTYGNMVGFGHSGRVLIMEFAL